MFDYKQLVFVYGSLKQGFHNHSVMEEEAGILVDTAETVDSCFTMYSLGSYPGVWNDGKYKIKGELYCVDKLSGLDHLEGYPKYYTRHKVKVRTGTNPDDFLWAWMYVLNSLHNSRPANCLTVYSGEWQKENVNAPF